MHIQKLILAAPIVFALSLAACAAQAPSDDRTTAARATADCLMFSRFYDWQPLDDNNLVIWGPGRNNAYRVTLTMPLFGLRSAFAISFVDGTRDGRMCAFGRDAIEVRQGTMRDRSSILSIEPLTAETLAQLEEKYKVTLNREERRKKTPKKPERETAE